ncbi:MAG: HNH endonuclease [Caldilineaceae bacterium]|nr:HNH endonuclease [Caldilineaceae bacterium]
MKPEEKFWNAVEKTDDCWLWTKGQTKGYGVLHINGSNAYAHRFSYELHKGPIPDGLFVCHSCDNPACVNPDHLWLGTAKENTADMIEKGRGMDTMKVNGTAMRIAMLQRGINTQAQLAQGLGFSRTTISNWMRGENILAGNVVILAQHLGIDPMKLVEFSNPATAPANGAEVAK